MAIVGGASSHAHCALGNHIIDGDYPLDKDIGVSMFTVSENSMEEQP
jgi:hypothetical protein